MALAAGCSSALFAVANLPSHFNAVRSHTDLAYGQDARQRLDVYSLPGASHRPIVVFWYGGAWTFGSKSDYRFVGVALAQHGYIAVLPDYRLYPAVKFPAFIEDGASAVRWVQQHAQELGGDPTRIVLMGHSAGAHLAATLALDPKYLAAAGGTRDGIVALVGLSGPYALAPDDDVLRTIFAAPLTSRDWQPLQHVDRQAPPTLLLHGLDDQRVWPIQAQQLHDALAQQGVRVEMQLYPKRGHADTIAGFNVFARHRTPTLERSTQFIDSVTHSTPSVAASSP